MFIAKVIFKRIGNEEKLAGVSGRLLCGPRKKPIIPLEKGETGDLILLHRNEAGFYTTNIPRRFTFSEEDAWGYGGTGSRCLAANILFHFLRDEKKVEEKASLLVEEVLMALPMDESCIIYAEFIEAWIKSKQ